MWNKGHELPKNDKYLLKLFLQVQPMGLIATEWIKKQKDWDLNWDIILKYWYYKITVKIISTRWNNLKNTLIFHYVNEIQYRINNPDSISSLHSRHRIKRIDFSLSQNDERYSLWEGLKWTYRLPL